jgi:RNA polymerase sigma-70 factor, ECF subfamily
MARRAEARPGDGFFRYDGIFVSHCFPFERERPQRQKFAFTYKAQNVAEIEHCGLARGILTNAVDQSRMEPGAPGEVTVLLQKISSGDSRAADRLVPLVLQELQELARRYLKTERPGHTLQATALVNEAYLRLVGDQARDWRNRAHFIGVSASIMRRILIDHARRKQALKRSAGEPAFELGGQPGLSSEQADELIALNSALDRLEQMNPRQRQVVELRYFGGLSLEETAEALGVSDMTVKRDWMTARAWLKGQVRPEAIS